LKIEAVRLVTDQGLAATPAAASSGNGQMQFDLAQSAAVKKQVVQIKAERDIRKKKAAFFKTAREVEGR
jgi:hypothetical protein